MSGEELMRRLASAFETSNLRPLFDAIDDDIVWKSGAAAGGPFRFGGVYRHRVGVLEATSRLAAECWLRRFHPKEIVASGDVVWGLFDVEGDYKGATAGARSGRPFRLELAIRWRLRGDKVVEHQGFFDTESLLRQVSGTPVEPPHPSATSPGEAMPAPLSPTEIVKQQVAAHWNRRAAHFDEDFGHSVKTSAERAAWQRIFGLVLPARGPLDALDCGCGTGFLSLELAARGHRVTGVDFAPAMIEAARAKAAELGRPAHFEAGDVERLRFPDHSFDVVLCRHLLWTLPHPEAAIDEWLRLLRPGGRLAVIESQADAADPAEPRDSARRSPEYAAIGDRLPFRDGRPQAEIEALLAARGLAGVKGDPLPDLAAAQRDRMIAEGLEPRPRRRYAVWGDKPSAG